jgi:Carboxypeptidase regulatory-like domain/TonB dependent receptor
MYRIRLRNFKNKISISFLLLFSTICMQAQITSASMSGKILNLKHETLLGASVIATHEPTGTVYRVVCDENGVFQIENMNTGGPYLVKTSMVGFKEGVQNNVFLTLGNTSKVDFILEESSTELNKIEVVSKKNDLFDGSKSGTQTNIGTDRIENLPTLSRSLQDITRLTPQGGANSFAGTNFRMNNLAIDGANANDAFSFVEPSGGASGSVASGTPGNLAKSQPISLDAIQEVQVSLSPYEVSQGNFTGGSINAVTRSGTNTLQGSVYGFGRNGSLTRSNSTIEGKKEAPQYLDWTSGFRLGGAIKQNKLFYFINVETGTRDEPVGFSAGSSGSSIPFDVAKQIADTLQKRYGINTGRYEDFNIKATNSKVFGRLDWNISDQHQLTFRHSFSTASAEHLNRASNILNFESQGFTHNNTSNVSVFQLKSRFKNNRFNDLIIGYSNIKDVRDPFGDVIQPHIEITYNTTNSIFAGTYREAAVFQINQRALELTDNFNFYKKNHAFQIGTHNELYQIGYHFVTPYSGRWAYSSLDNFFADRPSRLRATYNLADNDYNFNYNRPSADYQMLLASVYAQDRITVSDRLKILLGLRLDMPFFFDRETPSNEILQTPQYSGFANGYGNRLNVSPRVSFNYQPTAKLQIRGGAGVFTGRMPLAWLAYSHIYNGRQFGNVDVRFTGKQPILTDYAQFKTLQTPQREVNLVSNDFKMPQILRGNLAFDYKTKQGTTFTLEFLATKTIQDVLFQTLNLKDSTVTLSGGDGRKIYLGNNTTQKVQPQFTSVFGLKNTQDGFRYSISGSVSHDFNTILSVMGAYTYGLSKDISNGVRVSPQANWEWNHTTDANNPSLSFSNFDIRHRLIFSINYNKKWSDKWMTQVSLISTAASGSPYTYTYAGDLNRDASATNDLFFVPKDKSQINLVDIKDSKNAVVVTADEQWQQLNNYIQNDAYLSERRGQFSERNGARTPWNAQTDVRITQGFKLGKQLIQLSLDIINVGNLIDAHWGKQFFVSNTLNSSYQIATVASVTNDVATFRFNDPKGNTPYQVDPLASKWQGQLGLRWVF